MTTLTQHQRIACWTSDHTAVSHEWWQELYDAGARVAVLHLQDARDSDGNWIPVPRDYVDKLKAQGWKVWGAVRPSGNPLGGELWTPQETVGWATSEQREKGLNGLSLNGEQEVQQADLRGEGWSKAFAPEIRRMRPNLPMQLNTYPVEGLDHAPYIAAGFRLSGQTYSPTSLWEWPPAWYVNAQGTGWAQRVGWPKAKNKLCLPVHTIDGERATVEDTVHRMKAAGVVGCTLFPVNQSMPPSGFLVPLIKGLIAAGCAR